MKRKRGLRARTRGVALVIAMAMVVFAVGIGTAGAEPAAKKKGTLVLVEVGDTAGTKAPMTMTVSPTSAPAGKVTFTVTNTGTVIHEMEIFRTDTPYDKFPVVKNKASKPSGAKEVGEIDDIKKGQTKSATFKLKAGNYALICNISKHYGLGMRAPFTVT